MNNPLVFDYTLPAQMISFLLLVWFLGKVAWNPLMNMMEKRRVHIETSLAEAKEERQQAEQIKREYQEEMRQARQEAQEVIAKAMKVGEVSAAEILAAAHEETERIKKSALVDIQRERDQAIADVKGQAVELSILVAEKIIRQKLDFKGQSQLIEQFIQEVGELQ
ncbi:MAG TPA: F0F1 ATP synthase subunit B [Desulfosporosinus sp.]|nr:F0F1 ATP synthase subunit B [Desulfosporosinus sp.]